MTYKLTHKQKIGSDFIIARQGRAILADDMGLGKTWTALDAIHRLEGTPSLLVGIKPALYVWKDELKKRFNEESVVYSGNPKERAEAWQRFQDTNCKFLITNYAFVEEIKNLTLMKFWKTLVTDEYHLPGLLNRKTLIFNSIKSLARICPYLIMVTGTPMRSNLSELFAPFSLIDPKEFPSYWHFVGKHCIRTKTYFGYEIEARPKDVKAFIKLRQRYMIRRVNDDEFPPEIRQVITVEMTPEQKVLYRQMTKEMYMEFEDKIVFAQNKMVQILRQRQLLITPQIFGIPIVGGALEYLAEMVEAEFIAGKPVAVFTPFKKALPYIESAIRNRIKGEIVFFKLHGQMSAKKMHEVEVGFQTAKGPIKVVIGTIKSGTSVTLHAAKSSFFIGYEWKAYANVQAERRIARIGQTEITRHYYLLHRHTADERVKELINKSQQAMNWVFTPEEYMKEINKYVDN